eukprot:COSAG06_NODE_14695_length_1134_cov_1.510145_1_plen_80_part_00
MHAHVTPVSRMSKLWRPRVSLSLQVDTAVAQAVEELQAAALLKANAGNWYDISIETHPHATAAAARALAREVRKKPRII